MQRGHRGSESLVAAGRAATASLGGLSDSELWAKVGADVEGFYAAKPKVSDRVLGGWDRG